MNKTVNQKAWFLILPVLLLVAFSAVIPLMTVVNYSVQDTFGNNQFFWAGLEWFKDMMASERMWDALGRQISFSAIILAIEIPLGIFVALNMPKSGFWASLSYCQIWCLRFFGHAAIWSGFVVSIPSLKAMPVMTLAR